MSTKDIQSFCYKLFIQQDFQQRQEVVVKIKNNFNNETVKTKDICIIVVFCNTTSKFIFAEWFLFVNNAPMYPLF